VTTHPNLLEARDAARALWFSLRNWREASEEVAEAAKDAEAAATDLVKQLTRHPPDGGPPLWHRPIEETMPDLAKAMAEGRPADEDEAPQT
jgi:hypothetical protein